MTSTPDGTSPEGCVPLAADPEMLTFLADHRLTSALRMAVRLSVARALTNMASRLNESVADEF